MTGECFRALPASLEILWIKGFMNKLKPDCLLHLTRCPELRELDLRSFEARISMATVLAGCPRLSKLVVSGMILQMEQWLPRTGAPALQYLYEVGYADDAGFGRLPKLMPGLQTLELDSCNTKVTEVGMRHLHRCPQLRSLKIGMHVTDAMLKALHGAPLTELHLRPPMWSNKPVGFSARVVCRMVLACPSLTELCFQDYLNIVELVDALGPKLPLGRELTIYVSSNCMGKLRNFPINPRLHIKLTSYGEKVVGFPLDLEYDDD